MSNMEDYVPYKEWLHQHDERIRQEFPDRPTSELAGDMQENYYTVSRRAKRIGVGKSAAFMRSSWKKGGNRKGQKRSKYNGETGAYLKAHFADTSNEELAHRFGVDVKTVRRWARSLGLVKSEAFMTSARDRGRKNGAGRFYTSEQKAWQRQRIAEVYPDGDEEALCRLADELGVKRESIGSMASSFGIRRSEAFVLAGRAAHAELMRRCATKYGPEVIASLKVYYPDHTTEECAAHFGISKGVVSQLAIKHKIRKSREHMQKIRSEKRSKIKED